MDKPEPPKWAEGSLLEDWYIGMKSAINDSYTGHIRNMGSEVREQAYREWAYYLKTADIRQSMSEGAERS